MLKIKHFFEKDFFKSSYAAISKSNNERGYGKVIYLIADKSDDPNYAIVLPFEEMLSYLKDNNIEDVYFFGAAVMAYQLCWPFRRYIKNMGVEKYFFELPETILEEYILADEI
jgi:hypothetical protein